jgi:lysophospholipid acyltransferase (LPLAT)-like uncharacterized protein
MKALLNTPWLQILIATIASTYLRVCYATTRWESEGREAVEAVWAKKGPVIIMFWHERLNYGYACWPLDIAQPMAVLSSTSKFGDVMQRMSKSFHFHTIRGSSAKKSNRGKDKRGAPAFRDLLRWLRGNNGAATTPDGPRGPSRIMTEGSLKLSQISGADIICIGQSSTRYLQFNTWDHMRLPLPFARGSMVWKVLPPIPADVDLVAFEAYRSMAENALSDVTDRADDMLGMPRGTAGGRQVGREESHSESDGVVEDEAI